MLFNLSIDMPNIEIKKPNVRILDFLDINEKSAQLLNKVFKCQAHVNFAETLVNKLTLKGKVDYVISHKRLIKSLLNFQDKHETIWQGEFSYQDSRNYFLFKAPTFVII